MNEERMDQLGAQIDHYLDEIDESDKVAGFSEKQIQLMDIIIDAYCEIAMIGMEKSPEEWTPELMKSVMFSKFPLFLKSEEKTEELFQLIPQALINLITYLGEQNDLSDEAALLTWIDDNKKQLSSLNNPKFFAFYQKLQQAMVKDKIDTSNSRAVSEYTKRFLRENPQIARDLYTKK